MPGSADIIWSSQPVLCQHYLSSPPPVVLATALQTVQLQEVNRKLVSATKPTTCQDRLLPFPATFPYHTVAMHPDWGDGEEMAVGPHTQGKQLR